MSGKDDYIPLGDASTDESSSNREVSIVSFKSMLRKDEKVLAISKAFYRPFHLLKVNQYLGLLVSTTGFNLINY